MVLSEELSCKCTTKLLTVRTYRNGSKHYCYQCASCGMADSSMPYEKAKKLIDSGIKLHKHDENLRASHLRVVRSLANNDRADIKKQMLAEYNEYLQSPEWKSKRKQVIERESNLCEGCRKNKIDHIHHTNYNTIYKELLFDLRGLCSQCHAIIHEVNE